MDKIPNPTMKITDLPLEFVVTNDPELDYALSQEVWLDNQLLMDLRYINREWVVTFFTVNSKLSLEYLTEIQHQFNYFVQEQNVQRNATTKISQLEMVNA